MTTTTTAAATATTTRAGGARFCATAAAPRQSRVGAYAPQLARGARRHGTEHTRCITRGEVRHHTREQIHLNISQQYRCERCKLTRECRDYPR